MAGDYKGPGHKIVSGEVPEVGLRVMTNEYKWGIIVEVDKDNWHRTCGWYCEAWHVVQYADGKTVSMNCDRLTTRPPGGL